VLDVGIDGQGVRLCGCNELVTEIGEGLASLWHDLLREGLNDVREVRLSVLVMVADSDARGQRAPVGVTRAQRSRHLGRQLVELRGLDAVDNTRKDLLREDVGVHTEASGCLANPLENLIKGDGLRVTVALDNLHTIGVHGLLCLLKTAGAGAILLALMSATLREVLALTAGPALFALRTI